MNSVNGRIRGKYGRLRPCFAVIPVIVLRSYISVSVYGRIGPYTKKNGCRMQSPFSKTVNDRIFVCIPPYLFVYDTEIYDRNTITYKSSYFSVCGRLRPCLFDLGTQSLKVFTFIISFNKFEEKIVC